MGKWKRRAAKAAPIVSTGVNYLVPAAKPFTWAVQAVIDGRAAYKTIQHTEYLEELLWEAECADQVDITNGKTLLDDGQVFPDTLDALYYTINKKENKAVKRIIRIIPVAGSLGIGIYKIGKNLKKRWKGTLGKNREKYALILVNNAALGDTFALNAIVNLIGKKNYLKLHKDLVYSGDYNDMTELVEELMERMKSL